MSEESAVADETLVKNDVFPQLPPGTIVEDSFKEGISVPSEVSNAKSDFESTLKMVMQVVAKFEKENKALKEELATLKKNLGEWSSNVAKDLNQMKKAGEDLYAVVKFHIKG